MVTLREGGYYRTRSGKLVGPLIKVEHSVYPWVHYPSGPPSPVVGYTADGKLMEGAEHSLDLIEENYEHASVLMEKINHPYIPKCIYRIRTESVTCRSITIAASELICWYNSTLLPNAAPIPSDADMSIDSAGFLVFSWETRSLEEPL